MKTGTKAEKPSPLGVRVYAKHRKIIKKWAGRHKVSEAHVVRMALEHFDTQLSKKIAIA